ncbi:MAG: polyprenyl synthetase family protein [Polyangiales bacterium]
MTAVGAQTSFVNGVVERVNARLAELFASKIAIARSTSPEAEQLVSASAELTMRGGKRLRPAALYAGFVAVDAAGDPSRTLDVSAALELLQTYFLIQDDWMDGDEQRRGGPSVHAAFAHARGNAQLGASLAILASDLMSGFAWELIASAPFPERRLRQALAAFGQMHFEVVCGQQLDLLGHTEVALVHNLKTGSYTVRGPLRLGALLADAGAEQLAALERFGAPLGLAFQLRDDLLGAFGSASATGKPVGNDLRAGKRTALLSEARALLSSSGLAVVDAVAGKSDASDAAVARATEVLLGSGVRERLEAKIATLLGEAREALRRAPLSREGTAMLDALATALAMRDS